eukprot:561118-Amorphochlora_amoeboformis.AAC.1
MHTCVIELFILHTSGLRSRGGRGGSGNVGGGRGGRGKDGGGKQETEDVQLEGIRVNKCFKEFASRRESDSFIADERSLMCA